MSDQSQKKEGIYDARELGIPKMGLLGIQHMFAMFGATVLVPALTGLSVSTTLLFAGLGTLLFHLITKGKVPAFLGSSFAFLGGYFALAPNGEKELLPYACLGVACAGLVYLLVAALIKVFGTAKVMQFFPPIVTGPIIIAIGLSLSQSAIDNAATNWPIALIAIIIIIGCNIFGKGMIKIIPIMLGVVGSYVVAAISGDVDFSAVANAQWLGNPIDWNSTVFPLFTNGDTTLMITAIITIVPLALATMVEHIGDISAISSTVGQNFFKNPGLHRTLLGDGVATILASLFGGPANTTYGENTGVLSLSKVYDPRVIRIAAGLAVVFSFCPKVSALISCMPTATSGGASLILYGMISAVGVRNIVENQIDFEKSRNIIIAALVLVLAIGITYSSAGTISFAVGTATISLSGLAVGALAGIILNAILPGKDYVFDGEEGEAPELTFQVGSMK
ncbi:MAG: uracil-xanthine permease family protein [Lachnospiraceae bacterium]